MHPAAIGISPEFINLTFPFPSKLYRGATNDSMHFREIDLAHEVMVPVPQHVGAFGVTRKFHTHEGVDLYCLHGDPVYCMENGVVTSITPFTGEHAGSPWWNNTFAVLVEGEHGVINYGEIGPHPMLRVGDRVQQGDHIGDVIEVLLKDKGRPRSMLHLELRLPGPVFLETWEPYQPQPEWLRDPTPLLLEAAKNMNF